jgi:hypothetical protein
VLIRFRIRGSVQRPEILLTAEEKITSIFLFSRGSIKVREPTLVG